MLKTSLSIIAIVLLFLNKSFFYKAAINTVIQIVLQLFDIGKNFFEL